MADLINAMAPLSLVQFLLVTVAMGGSAAYSTGKALASTWRPYWQMPVYMLGLAAIVRFCHYALFEDVLLDPAGYVRDLIVLLVASRLGYRLVRARQMVRQYGWLYEAAGPLRWRPRR